MTWEQVDEMTLPQVLALGRHFKKFPPLRTVVVMVAQSLGVTIPSDTSGPEGVPPPAPEFTNLPEFE